MPEWTLIVRHGGKELARFTGVPCPYVVQAQMNREEQFRDVRYAQQFIDPESRTAYYGEPTYGEYR